MPNFNIICIGYILGIGIMADIGNEASEGRQGSEEDLWEKLAHKVITEEK